MSCGISRWLENSGYEDVYDYQQDLPNIERRERQKELEEKRKLDEETNKEFGDFLGRVCDLYRVVEDNKEAVEIIKDIELMAYKLRDKFVK